MVRLNSRTAGERSSTLNTSLLPCPFLASSRDSDSVEFYATMHDSDNSSPEETDLDSLKGSLILADPRLKEPTFRHSVLLLTEHSEEMGAHGYILNRPLGKSVGELLPDSEFEGLGGIPVFVGGPVSTEHLTFLSFGWSEMDNWLQYSTHLSAKEAQGHQAEGFSVRAFVGYAGWTSGQLESEVEEDTWISWKPDQSIIQLDDLDTLWRRMLREVSPWHRLQADEPDDLRLN
ncbi:YqgE/AlgH family protein [Verrucomicrobiales bacterium]|nr:YqgE/AlgH family protein [Verrucomicrobiales bacterium]